MSLQIVGSVMDIDDIFTIHHVQLSTNSKPPACVVTDVTVLSMLGLYDNNYHYNFEPSIGVALNDPNNIL
jgi:hypothetical protein